MAAIDSGPGSAAEGNESKAELYPTACAIYRGILGEETGRNGNWPPFYLCTYHFYHSKAKLRCQRVQRGHAPKIRRNENLRRQIGQSREEGNHRSRSKQTFHHQYSYGG